MSIPRIAALLEGLSLSRKSFDTHVTFTSTVQDSFLRYDESSVPFALLIQDG